MKQLAKKDVPKLDDLYDEDFYAWTIKAAELVRRGRFQEVNPMHVAEELEDMGRSEKREMASRLEKVAAHVLKWAMQPKHRSTSWRRTINDQRRALERLFETNPSLRQLAQTELEKEYRRAIRGASDETGLPKEAFPSQCPFIFDDVMDENYWPDPFPAENR